MNTVEQLTAMKKILTEKGWGQGSFAQNKLGKAEPFFSPDVVSYCVVGAARVHGLDVKLVDVCEALCATLPEGFIDEDEPVASRQVVAYNDHPKTTFKDVMAWIDRAILWAQERAK